jgi:hypothetical protein
MGAGASALALAGNPPTLALLSTVHILLGAATFLRHGGTAFTGTGVYLLGSSVVFAGFGGMILAREGGEHAMSSLVTASGLVLLVNVATLVISTQARARGWATPVRRPPRIPIFRARDTERFLALTSLAFVCLWLLTVSLAPSHAPVVSRFGFASIVLVAALLLATHPAKNLTKSRIRRTSAIAVLVGAYFLFSFTGGGRLILAALTLSLLLVLNYHSPQYWHKWVCILTLVPGLVWAGYVRSGQDDLFEGTKTVATNADGLGSLYAPLETFADLLDLNAAGELDRAHTRWGGTFVTSALFWVPRDWWPGKPEGLGRELVHLLRPDRLHTGHSMAALNHGEWLVNFGLVGLLIGAFALGWALRLLDIALRRAHESSKPDPFRAALLAVVTGHLVLYAWADSFSFMSRAGLILLFLWLAKQAYERSRTIQRRVGQSETGPVRSLSEYAPQPRTDRRLPPVS